MNRFKDELLSKNGKVTIELAKVFMSMEEGDRILTVEQLSEKHKIGRGTVQSALKKIQSMGALKLESRGHLGTYITYINYEKLWEIADIGIITGVMPLPYSNRYEGLATGLYKVFDEINIFFNLAYMRGAVNRMNSLENSLYSFAIVSKIAANERMKDSGKIEIIGEFTNKTYSGEHVILLNKSHKSIEDGLRIAVDSSSVDQVILTQYEFKDKNVHIVDIPYNQIPNQMEQGNIDATIWKLDELQITHTKFQIAKLRNEKAKDLIKNYTSAVIVGRKENHDFNKVLGKLINMEKIEEIQQKVINKEIIPTF